ncbi:MAG TPA: FGGY-family carbohydrate kinase [Candidatus Lokiarchaeia archaeon]|nr:FGGY-family carbohydrate kinase [Candidatus Lokiarchaeia archaeon]
MLYCGIDVGTSSVKVIVMDEAGKIPANTSERLPESHFFQDERGLQCHEANPKEWWVAARACLKRVTKELIKVGQVTHDIAGICVTGTSGTMLFLDGEDRPLANALMYNDNRAVAEANAINEAAADHCAKLGYQFGASFGLPKILWVQRHWPEIWTQTVRVIHCSDYIVGKLTGEFGVSDSSNALKTGFDLLDLQWPSFIQDSLQLDLAKFPIVKEPGDEIAPTSSELERETGIPAGTPVLAGVTDSTASLLSSGAADVGDISSVLGSTIVEKAVASDIVKDPLGRLYSHRLPFGKWIPGGASNVGAQSLTEQFGAENLQSLDQEVFAHTPTGAFVYPLPHQGERFPFNNACARAFEVGYFSGVNDRYAAYIEGLCFAERMMLDVFEELGMVLGTQVFSVGGATKSAPWMQLRATILNRDILIPEVPEAAFGCALLVGCKVAFSCDLTRACPALISMAQTYHPDPAFVDVYQNYYEQFKQVVQEKMETEWV